MRLNSNCSCFGRWGKILPIYGRSHRSRKRFALQGFHDLETSLKDTRQNFCTNKELSAYRNSYGYQVMAVGIGHGKHSANQVSASIVSAMKKNRIKADKAGAALVLLFGGEGTLLSEIMKVDATMRNLVGKKTKFHFYMGMDKINGLRATIILSNLPCLSREFSQS